MIFIKTSPKNNGSTTQEILFVTKQIEYSLTIYFQNVEMISKILRFWMMKKTLQKTFYDVKVLFSQQNSNVF